MFVKLIILSGDERLDYVGGNFVVGDQSSVFVMEFLKDLAVAIVDRRNDWRLNIVDLLD